MSDANYYGMWHTLKEAIKDIVTDDEMIHLSDLESLMDRLYSDEKY